MPEKIGIKGCWTWKYYVANGSTKKENYLALRYQSISKKWILNLYLKDENGEAECISHK
jgi:hypothetical protein